MTSHQPVRAALLAASVVLSTTGLVACSVAQDAADEAVSSVTSAAKASATAAVTGAAKGAGQAALDAALAALPGTCEDFTSAPADQRALTAEGVLRGLRVVGGVSAAPDDALRDRFTGALEDACAQAPTTKTAETARTTYEADPAYRR